MCLSKQIYEQNVSKGSVRIVTKDKCDCKRARLMILGETGTPGMKEQQFLYKVTQLVT